MIRFKKIYSKLLIILVYSVLNLVSANENSSNIMKIIDNYNNQPRSLLKYNTEKALQNKTDDDYIAYDLQIVLDAIGKLNFTKCAQDAMIVMESMAKKERWALQMFDSSSKFPMGLLYGNFYQLGNFDECVNLKQPITTATFEPIQGQYCLADIELSKKNQNHDRVTRSFEQHKKLRHVFNNIIHWSICVPASCTTEDVKIIIKQLFTLATKDKKINVNLPPENCYVNKFKPFTPMEIIYGSILGGFLVLAIMATTFHYYILQKSNTENKSTLKEFIICFSLIHNVGKFLTTKSSDLNLNCIAGIKILSMLFILSGHTCLFLIGGPVQNTLFFDKQSRHLTAGIFSNSPLLVDTFLLVGGFLLCYLFLLELEKRGKVNIFILYIARYIRLTPSYLVILGFYCTFLTRTGDGPLWDIKMKLEQERCKESWWTNLLYINNYVNTDAMCMFQSWYLAVDYHLFIIAPIIIYLLLKRKNISKYLLGIAIITSVITPFVITLKDKLDPSLLTFAPEVFDITKNFYFKNAYIKTHMRAGSYFIGVLLGYILYKFQTKGTKIPKYLKWFGWCFSSICGIISLFSIVIFYDPDHEYNTLESAIYAAFHRVAWCISIGWVIIMCITKNAGPINSFLSWKPFICLSRLTYCAYLVNGYIELYGVATLRSGVYMSRFEITCIIISHLILTFVGAFILCIFFESPIHGFEKFFLKRDFARRQRHEVNSENRL